MKFRKNSVLIYCAMAGLAIGLLCGYMASLDSTLEKFFLLVIGFGFSIFLAEPSIDTSEERRTPE